MLLYFFGLGLLTVQAFALVNQTVEQIPDYHSNATETTLWRTLLKNCKTPTVHCVQKNMYEYLKQVLDYPKDYSVTSFLKFAKNSLNFTEDQDEFDDVAASFASNDTNFIEARSSMDEFSVVLQKQGLKFLMTHDLELKLPDLFFGGSILKVAPRSLDENGALVKVEFSPRGLQEGASEGRIFFKKLKKKIGQKLVHALIAIVAVIALLAVKFLFFLPMLLGVATAKKLLIKVLFFIFPAIKHVFKLCPYVPHGVKHHHHKHHIAHVHHVGPSHHHHKPHYHEPHYHEGIEIIRPHADGPPIEAYGSESIPSYAEIDSPPPTFYPFKHDVNFYNGPPGEKPDYILHRQDEDNEIYIPTKKKAKPASVAELENMVLKAEREAMIKQRLQEEKKRIQDENARLQEQVRQALKYQEHLKRTQMNVLTRTSPIVLKGSMPTVPSPFLQSPPPPASDQVLPVNSLFNVHDIPRKVIKFTGPEAGNMVPNGHAIQSMTTLSRPADGEPPTLITNYGLEAFGGSTVSRQGTTATAQETIAVAPTQVTGTTTKVHPVKPTKKKEYDIEKAIQQAASITYDPFYSPILQKVDKILGNLGYAEESCKERLICFMYKSPEKYSPHSNLVSHELSRDPSELVTPKNTNAAVLRFYKYVDAARDGQNGHDCVVLYPDCDRYGSEK